MLLCVSPAKSAEPHLFLTTEDGPPFNMPGSAPDEVTGMSTELLRLAFEKSAIAYSISLYPWARAYKQARTQPNTCVFSTERNDERESLFKWVGPLYHNEWILVTRHSAPPVTRLEDIKDHPIGGNYDDATTDYLQRNGYQVDKSTDDLLNVRKLESGRVDYWVVGRPRARYAIRRTGFTDLEERLSIKEAINYLACNKSVPDDLVGKLNAALAALQGDGTAERIAKKYQ